MQRRSLAGDAHDCRFVVNVAADGALTGLTEKALVEKANATLALLAEAGIRGPIDMAFVSATRMCNKSVTYHLNAADGPRWLSQPAVRPKFIAHFEGASSAISSLLHCVVEYVPVSFDPTDLASVERVETANDLGAKTIQFAKWFKQPEHRLPTQRTAFMLMGFLTREAANLAIAKILVIDGRVCLVWKLLAEPRRCLHCQKWDPGHLRLPARPLWTYALIVPGPIAL